MSLRPDFIDDVPETTATIAIATFPKGNNYLKMRDELGVFFTDEQFADLFSHTGQRALAPWRLALVTVMQFAENLTDRQAADSVRSRIDWKYVLGLEIDDIGFDYSVLSEFRSRLIAGSRESMLLDSILTVLKAKKLVKAHGRQRTDSSHILTAVRTLNRLELVGETFVNTDFKCPLFADLRCPLFVAIDVPYSLRRGSPHGEGASPFSLVLSFWASPKRKNGMAWIRQPP